jgi:hypothetical protein
MNWFAHENDGTKGEEHTMTVVMRSWLCKVPGFLFCIRLCNLRSFEFLYLSRNDKRDFEIKIDSEHPRQLLGRPGSSIGISSGTGTSGDCRKVRHYPTGKAADSVAISCLWPDLQFVHYCFISGWPPIRDVVYLKTRGIDPKSHPVVSELVDTFSPYLLYI